jgi:4-hydroxy-tetrahydrodipicolinate reductase
MKPIRVAVHGALGKMGQTLVDALCREPEMQLVGATDIKATQDHLTLPDGSARIPLSKELESILNSCKPEVVVDFSNAKAVMPLVRLAAERGVNLVIGTTGIAAEDIKEIDRLAKAKGVGIVVAPNFALGAVLMMHLAKIAGKYLDFAEIIELHHEDSRGKQVEGISIHSVRLPGLLAHQEVILGGAGQTLSIRHDTSGRECYMPGVMLAIKEVTKKKGLIYGLDSLLGLEK